MVDFLFTSMVAAFFCVLSHHSLKLNLVTVSSILINVSVYEFHQIHKLDFSFGGCEKLVPCDWYIKVGTYFNDTVADYVVGTNSNDTIPVDVVYEEWILLLLLKFNSIIEIMTSSSLDPSRMGLFCGVENPIGSFLLLSLLFWVVSQFSLISVSEYWKYIPVVWRCASILTLAWTFSLLKTNAFTQLSSYFAITGVTLEKCTVVDKLISICMILVGLVASAHGYHKDLYR